MSFFHALIHLSQSIIFKLVIYEYHEYCNSAVPCQLNPCANGGTCSAQDTTNYTCTCAANFTGTDCSSDINFCTPTTCLNDGTCIEGYGTETLCVCTKEFSGPNCTMCVDGKLLQVNMTGYSNQVRIIVPFFIIIILTWSWKPLQWMFYLLELSLKICQVKEV